MKRNQSAAILSILLFSIAIILSSNVFAQKPFKPAVTPMYEIGLPGPAGGIVFYISDGGGNRIRGRHGMEMAPQRQSPAEGVLWGDAVCALDTSNHIGIGSGAESTSMILTTCVDPKSPAAIAAGYTLNGYDDWYLPSFGELNMMIKNICPLGKMESILGTGNNSNLWTSTVSFHHDDTQRFYDVFTLRIESGIMGTDRDIQVCALVTPIIAQAEPAHGKGVVIPIRTF